MSNQSAVYDQKKILAQLSPQEISGLVALASYLNVPLTINPATGRPENLDKAMPEISRGLASLKNAQKPYATSKYFDPNDPFKAGQNLNKIYGDNALLDHRRYGGRYANELSTEGGRQRLGTDIGYAAQNTGQTGVYRNEDFNSLIGFENLNDPNVIKSYASYFPQGNSYFVPDKIEADPYQYAYHGFTADSMSKPDQDAAFNAMHGGSNLARNAAAASGDVLESGVNPEATIRRLLNAKSNPRHFTPDVNREAAYNQLLGQSAGLLAGMDVGRGNISTEQGNALAKASEWKRYLDSSNTQVTNTQNAIQNLQNQLANLRVDDLGNTETYNQKKAAYEGQIQSNQNILNSALQAQRKTQETLNPYLNTVRTITDPTALSSAEVIGLLNL